MIFRFSSTACLHGKYSFSRVRYKITTLLLVAATVGLFAGSGRIGLCEEKGRALISS